MSGKIIPLAKLVKTIASLKRRGKKIVFTNGCFDILHRGHTTYLAQAKKLGNILIVGVNSDSSVKSLKGSGRPINKLPDRMEILASLESIDYVCPFTQLNPLQLIKKIRPHILVKGGDWKSKGIVGSEFVKSYGGRVKTIALKKGYSTTNLIKRLAIK